MSTIVTRAGKGSPLTHNEVDANFNNLNNDKYQSGSSPSFAGTTLSSGNLTFSSTAQRITGDMSNATLSNRLAFQTSTTNGNTTISALPNGTAVGAACRLHNSSDPANSSRVAMGVDSSITYLESAINGTGSYLPMTFYTGGSERVRIDTTGRVGIGLTNPTVSLQVANTSGNVVVFSNTTAGERLHFYTRNAASTSRVESQNSDLEVYTFDANALKLGTSNTERMRIDTSGNVGIGTASPGAKLDVQGGRSYFAANSDAFATYLRYNSSTAGVFLGSPSADAFQISKSSGAAYLNIDSSGNVGIGGTAAANAKVHVLGTLPTSSNNSQAFRMTGEIPSGSTTLARSFFSFPSTQAASFTLTDLYHFDSFQGSFGAGSAVTNQYGFHAGSSLTGATNNYGFFSNIASGSNRWNFYAAGTAKNYFAGDVFIGTTTAVGTPNVSIYVAGGGETWQLGPEQNGNFIVYNDNDTGVYITNGQTSWTANSDERIKTALKPIENAASKVSTLRAVTGRYTSDAESVSRAFLIAQDVQAVLPEAVDVPAKESDPLGLRYTDVVPLLVAAIKELTARVAELEAK
jgi:hypothetical protein